MNDLEKEVVREKKIRRKPQKNVHCKKKFDDFPNLQCLCKPCCDTDKCRKYVYLGKLHKCGNKNGPYTG